MAMADGYRDPIGWQKATQLAPEVHRCTQNFPKHELLYVERAASEHMDSRTVELGRILNGLTKSVRESAA
jgi:hypothetical protein